jgi:hypothetical protein
LFFIFPFSFFYKKKKRGKEKKRVKKKKRVQRGFCPLCGEFLKGQSPFKENRNNFLGIF